jgi:tRNA-dihydrouridine synthase B
MISAKGVYYKDQKTVTLARAAENETPYALQIFGSDPEIMAYSSKALIESNPEISIIDINMGCPMPKITGNGDGSALMKNPSLAGKIVRAVSDAVKLPVTVKMRTGWDADSINAPYLAAVCEQNGAALITVHGRTREQLYSPPVDAETIRLVKKEVKIPVIANGGIYNGHDALILLEKTMCDGVMVGQGALGNPWIFSEIECTLNGKSFARPEIREIIELAKRHVEMLCIDKGEYLGVREARKHLGWYIKGQKGASSARDKINKALSKEEIYCILNTLV